MPAIANSALAALTKALSHQFMACLRGVSEAPLEPAVREALTHVGGVICPGEPASSKAVTPQRIAEVIAAQHPKLGGIWRVDLERSPRRLCAAAVSMVEGAKNVQKWVNDTFSPGTPAQLWLEATLAMGPILEQIAEARRSHRPTRAKSATPPANQEVSKARLVAALEKHPKNRSAAAREVGLAPQTVDARIEAAGRDDPDLGRFWRPRRHPVSNAALAGVIAEVGGVDTYSKIKEAARRLGWRSPSKVMDRVWSAGPNDPDLGEFWRPKRPGGRPPKATEMETAGVVEMAPTRAAASDTLSIAPSTLARRVLTAQTAVLRIHKRAPDAPHPGLRVDDPELLAALEGTGWNQRKTSEILDGRISQTAIGARLASAREGSDLKKAHQAWLAAKIY